ncbi:hypothetical protein D3C71_1305980 [compost metagenome]
MVWLHIVDIVEDIVDLILEHDRALVQLFVVAGHVKERCLEHPIRIVVLGDRSLDHAEEQLVTLQRG